MMIIRCALNASRLSGSFGVHGIIAWGILSDLRLRKGWKSWKIAEISTPLATPKTPNFRLLWKIELHISVFVSRLQEPMCADFRKVKQSFWWPCHHRTTHIDSPAGRESSIVYHGPEPWLSQSTEVIMVQVHVRQLNFRDPQVSQYSWYDDGKVIKMTA